MKTLIVLCCSIFLVFCRKGFDIDLSGPINSNFSGYTIISDTNNKLKADIAFGGTISHFSVSGGWYQGRIYPGGDSSSFHIQARTDSLIIIITLNNIVKPGSYSFGYTHGQRKGADASFLTLNDHYNSKHDEISGSINIDSLTTKRIKGSFAVTCWNGTRSADITNGTFVGNFQ